MLAVGALISLVGCGGDHGSVPASHRVLLFATDGPREDFAHIWATIYQVTLVPQSGAPIVVFDDPSGQAIDLRTLRDSSGERFSFLGSATIPEGTYTGVTVAIGATMEFFRNNSTTSESLAVDNTLPRDDAGHVLLQLMFRVPRVLNEATNLLVLDFNLARFIVRASGVLPALEEGNPAALGDPARHNPGEYCGIVGNLNGTAPDLTFTLTNPRGQSVTVVTTASTAVYGTGSLANGVFVCVRGIWDASTQRLLATRLAVCPAGPPPVGIAGIASNVNATAGTFDVTVQHARGLVPRRVTLSVTTNSATVFRAADGSTQTASEFFATLAGATNPLVEVAGTYDPTAHTVAALAVRGMDALFDGGLPPHPHQFRPGVSPPAWGHGVFQGLR